MKGAERDKQEIAASMSDAVSSNHGMDTTGNWETATPVPQERTNSFLVEADCEPCYDLPSNTKEDSEEEIKLTWWAIDNIISHNAHSKLLNISPKDHPNLSKDLRSLLETDSI